MSEEVLGGVVGAVRADSGAIIQAGMTPRYDSWENVIFGIGGYRDPSSHTHYRLGGRLSDQEIEGVLAGDHFGAKGVEALPKHAMRSGWDLASAGEPVEIAKLRDAYALEEKRLLVREKMTEGARWGRAFGGAVTWMGIDDGREQYLPVDEAAIQSVEFLHTLDRRYVFIASYYQDPAHPKYGKPELYRLLPTPLPALSITPTMTPFSPQTAPSFTPQALRGLDVIGSLVHESRIVRWPGQPVTFQRRLLLQGWEDSVLERAWEPLKQVAEDFAGKSLLLGRISQAIYYIKKLYELGAGKEADALRARMSQIDLSRSRSRAVLLDAEREKFENVATPMGGMSELMTLGMQRLASAYEMPVSVLIEMVTGGNIAASDADAERWDGTAITYRADDLGPRHSQIARAILLAKNGPTGGKPPEHWEIKYRPLRQQRPDAIATVRKTNAEAAALMIDKGVVPPEAYALAWFTANGTGEPLLDMKEVEAAMERRRMLASKPPKDNAELGTVSARAGGGVLEVLAKLNAGEITRGQAKAVLMLTFTLTAEDAETQMDTAAEIEKLEPKVAPSVPPGPPPAPAKGTGAGAPQGLPGFNAGGDPNDTKDPTKS